MMLPRCVPAPGASASSAARLRARVWLPCAPAAWFPRALLHALESARSRQGASMQLPNRCIQHRPAACCLRAAAGWRRACRAQPALLPLISPADPLCPCWALYRPRLLVISVAALAFAAATAEAFAPSPLASARPAKVGGRTGACVLHHCSPAAR
jgi:hypothetical protein